MQCPSHVVRHGPCAALRPAASRNIHPAFLRAEACGAERCGAVATGFHVGLMRMRACARAFDRRPSSSLCFDRTSASDALSSSPSCSQCVRDCTSTHTFAPGTSLGHAHAPLAALAQLVLVKMWQGRAPSQCAERKSRAQKCCTQTRQRCTFQTSAGGARQHQSPWPSFTYTRTHARMRAGAGIRTHAHTRPEGS